MTKKIFVVIPWRLQERRLFAFNKVVEWYITNFPNIKIVITDSRSVEFSTANAKNRGFEKAVVQGADIVIFHDADSFVSVESLNSAIEASIIRNVIAIPYTSVAQHSEEDSVEFFSSGRLKNASQIFTCPRFDANGKLNKMYPCGGVVVVPVDVFRSIGGFNETLTSWGPEDQLFHMEYIKKYNDTFMYVEGVLHSTYNYTEQRKNKYPVVKQEIQSFVQEYTQPKNNIFVFWAGLDADDYMSENRKKCYLSLVRNSGCKITLVTSQDLYLYEVEGYPVHEGYKYLSSTHKSDYARSYLMRHYGGGYSDIKNCEFDWNPYFTALEESDKDFAGYAEIKASDCGYQLAGTMFEQIAGNGMFIFKKDSLTSILWYEEVQRKLDNVLDLLKNNPGTYLTRHQVKTKDAGYPLSWAEVQGEIFHKIQYENLGRSILTMPYVDTKNYI